MIYILFKREFLGYFRTPVAYVFLAIFAIGSIVLPWFAGSFFDSNIANLDIFFRFLPWVYLFLIPAAGMRLWSEEIRSGTWELLFTLPIKVSDAVIGKFLAGWAFIGVGLCFTLTMPLTLAYLGNPDWERIIAGYIGAFLMAGTYLSICSLISALTQNQVIAFVLSVLSCLILLLLGWSLFSSYLERALPTFLVDALSNFSFITHFETMFEGLIQIKDIIYFASGIAFFTSLNVIVLDRN